VAVEGKILKSCAVASSTTTITWKKWIFPGIKNPVKDFCLEGSRWCLKEKWGRQERGRISGMALYWACVRYSDP
jgi:hypothetical protein